MKPEQKFKLDCVSIDKNKLSPEKLAYLEGEMPIDYLMKKIRSGTKVRVNKNWIKSKEGKARLCIIAESNFI